MNKIILPIIAASIISCSEYRHEGPKIDFAAKYDSEINRVVVYGDLHRPWYGLSFLEFTKVSGLEKILPDSLNELGVWVNADDNISEPTQQYSAGDGRVAIKIPTKMGPDVLRKVMAYKYAVLGIPKDTSKNIDGFP